MSSVIRYKIFKDYDIALQEDVIWVQVLIDGRELLLHALVSEIKGAHDAPWWPRVPKATDNPNQIR